MKNHSKQRETILDILRKSYSHPTADEVFEEAKNILPNISLATVYRNLDELVKNNLIKKIPTNASKDRYDLPKSNHFHAICNSCGSVYDIELNFSVKELENQVYAQCKLECNPNNIIINGICKDCQN